MAYIRKRGEKFSVVYRSTDADGIVHQKSETYGTLKEAETRRKEIEYKVSAGQFEIPKCTVLSELLDQYVQIYGEDKWAVSTYGSNISLINNYILPTIGDKPLSDINNLFLEKYYKELLKMPAVRSTRNAKEQETITPSTIEDIHKLLKSCFRQAVKWGLMDKNPAIDATIPKYKKEKRDIWTAEMLMQAIEACDNKWLKVAFHLSFTATLRLGEVLGLTWDCVDISEEAIAENRSYIVVNKIIERVSKNAVDRLNAKDVIMIFPNNKSNNTKVY